MFIQCYSFNTILFRFFDNWWFYFLAFYTKSAVSSLTSLLTTDSEYFESMYYHCYKSCGFCKGKIYYSMTFTNCIIKSCILIRTTKYININTPIYRGVFGEGNVCGKLGFAVYRVIFCLQYALEALFGKERWPRQNGVLQLLH